MTFSYLIGASGYDRLTKGKYISASRYGINVYATPNLLYRRPASMKTNETKVTLRVELRGRDVFAIPFISRVVSDFFSILTLDEPSRDVKTRLVPSDQNKSGRVLTVGNQLVVKVRVNLVKICLFQYLMSSGLRRFRH